MDKRNVGKQAKGDELTRHVETRTIAALGIRTRVPHDKALAVVLHFLARGVVQD
jgi:hypothetical protein